MACDPPDPKVFIERISYFALFGHSHLELARWLAVALLVIVASGWYPRITGLVHWWISVSLQMSATTIDGGDQITADLTILLLPMTLTDTRRTHWEQTQVDSTLLTNRLRLFFALFSYVLIRIQMAGVYLHASVAKFAVSEWADGTSIYYWAIHPTFGYPAWLKPIALWLLKDPVVVCCTTWGVMFLEYLLSAALFLPKKYWKWLLFAGIAFHFAIAILHGLVSFGIAMTAGLILYLRPLEQVFCFGGRSSRRVKMVAQPFCVEAEWLEERGA
jgi:antimicrobial peptide system SdpB family protein